MLPARSTYLPQRARGNLEQIKSGYVALGARVKGTEAQVVFLSIIPVKGKGLTRSRCWNSVASRLWHGVVFKDDELQERNEIYLMKKGKGVFTDDEQSWQQTEKESNSLE